MNILYKKIQSGSIAYKNLHRLYLTLTSFSEDQLSGFTTKEDWQYLSRNRNLPFSRELIQAFADRWNWEELCLNRGIPWTVELIDAFAFPDYRGPGGWDIRFLGINDSFCRNKDLVERYIDRLNLTFSIDHGMFSDWSAEEIASRINHTNYKALTDIAIEKLIRIRDEKLIDEKLLKNSRLKIKIVEKPTLYDIRISYVKKDGSTDSARDQKNWKPVYDIDEALAVREEEDKRKGYYGGWPGSDLCWRSDVPWTLESLAKYEEHLNWGEGFGSGVAFNRGLFWTEEIIRKFHSHFEHPDCRRELSKNPSLPWSEEFLEEFDDLFDWDILCEFVCDKVRGPEQQRFESLYRLFAGAVNNPDFAVYREEAGIKHTIWEWIESISPDEVTKAYRRSSRKWKRKPFLGRMEDAAALSPEQSGEILIRFIRNCLTRENIQLCGACYGPSRMNRNLFYAFLSQLYLEGEESFNKILQQPFYVPLSFILTSRPENLFAPLMKALSPSVREDLDREVDEALSRAALTAEDYEKAFPLIWICFPKKEFTPPLWDLIPGKGLGPFSLGMSRVEARTILGEPESLDDYSGAGIYRHGHLRLLFEDEKLVRITIDRFGEWGCLAHGDRVNKIHHFRVRAFGRFPFEEEVSYFPDHFIHVLKEYGEVEIDRYEDYKYPVYQIAELGLSVRYFDRDYKKYPVTEIDITNSFSY